MFEPKLKTKLPQSPTLKNSFTKKAKRLQTQDTLSFPRGVKLFLKEDELITVGACGYTHEFQHNSWPVPPNRTFGRFRSSYPLIKC